MIGEPVSILLMASPEPRLLNLGANHDVTNQGDLGGPSFTEDLDGTR